MASIILTGATGTAGSGILQTALNSPLVSHVTVLGRRAPPVTHPKLSTVLVPSDELPRGFDELSKLTETLKAQKPTACIWALGISQTEVSKDEYIRITHDWTLEAIKAFEPLGTPEQPFRFVWVSGEGADQAERSYTLFGKIKGRAERALKAAETPAFQTVSVRPGGILPTAEHYQTLSFTKRVFTRGVGGLIGSVMPSMVIPAPDLGVATVALAAAAQGWDRRTAEGWIPNKVLREMVAAYQGDVLPSKA